MRKSSYCQKFSPLIYDSNASFWFMISSTWSDFRSPQKVFNFSSSLRPWNARRFDRRWALTNHSESNEPFKLWDDGPAAQGICFHVCRNINKIFTYIYIPQNKFSCLQEIRAFQEPLQHKIFKNKFCFPVTFSKVWLNCPPKCKLSNSPGNFTT